MMGKNPLDMLERLPGDAKQKAYQQLTQQLIEGEAGDILTGLIAAKEISMLEAVDDLHDEMGIDHIDGIPAHDERKDQLKGLVEALVTGDLPGFWFDHVGEARLDNPQDAREYLDLDGEEWAAEIDVLVTQYRRQGSDLSRSAIVADYVNRKFGVEVEWFVAHVVNWTEGQERNVAKQFLLGNFEGVERGVRIAEQAVREHNEQARDTEEVTDAAAE